MGFDSHYCSRSGLAVCIIQIYQTWELCGQLGELKDKDNWESKAERTIHACYTP